jgi:hypothetical protein
VSSLDVEFEVESADVAILHEWLLTERAEDVEEFRDEGFVPLAVVVVSAIIAAHGLANIVVALSRLRGHGVIVDARGDTVRTQTEVKLPRGSVLVLARDGTRHELSTPQPLDLAAILSTAE